MELKKINVGILIPEGYEIDEEKSTFEEIVLKEKPTEVRKVWNNIGEMYGFVVDLGAKITPSNDSGYPYRDIYATKKQAESARAKAQISQILQKWYKPFTDEEWSDIKIIKYVIERSFDQLIYSEFKHTYHFLAFRTEKEAKEFMSFPENEQLVKDFYEIVDKTIL